MGAGDIITTKTFLDLARSGAGAEVTMQHQGFGRYDSIPGPGKGLISFREGRLNFIPSPITRIQLFWDGPLSGRGTFKLWGIR